MIRKLRKIDHEMKIKCNYNSSYKVKSEKSLLRWDFHIEYENKHLFIEYQGKQHYQAVCFGGISQEKAEKAFEKQKIHDKLKDDFCKENDYPILWIKYTEFGEINKLVADFIIKNTNWGIEDKNI